MNIANQTHGADISEETADISFEEFVDSEFNEDEDKQTPEETNDDDSEVEADDETDDSEDDEAEDSEEEIDEESDEEEVEDEDQESDTFEIKFEGKLEKVTKSELIELAQKGKDYTHKTTELAREREVLQEKSEETAKTLEMYQQNLEIMEKIVGGNTLSPEQLNRILSEQGTEAYTRAKAQNDAQVQRYQAIRSEHERVKQEKQQENDANLQKKLVEGRDILQKAMPELLTDEGITKMRNYLSDYGYSNEELNQIYDPNHLMIAEKARMWDELKSSNKVVQKKVKTAPKVLKKNSARKTKSELRAERNSRAAKALGKGGATRQSAIAFEEFID